MAKGRITIEENTCPDHRRKLVSGRCPVPGCDVGSFTAFARQRGSDPTSAGGAGRAGGAFMAEGHITIEENKCPFHKCTLVSGRCQVPGCDVGSFTAFSRKRASDPTSTGGAGGAAGSGDTSGSDRVPLKVCSRCTCENPPALTICEACEWVLDRAYGSAPRPHLPPAPWGSFGPVPPKPAPAPVPAPEVLNPCPACTFANPLTESQCQVCGSPLTPVSAPW